MQRHWRESESALWILVILGVVAGVFIGMNSPLVIPAFLAKYMSVAILAALDSVLGGLRSSMEEKFDSLVLITGFLVTRFSRRSWLIWAIAWD